jgi:EAL domain-containing protein (putative c-di-GMP-specific phosphodiesterase class I)
MTRPSPRHLIDRLHGYPELRKALRVAADGNVVGRFYEFDLASGFQRIVRLDTSDTIAYDAYARSRGQAGDTISPWGLFSRAAEDVTVVWLDRLCRVVHTLNYVAQDGADVPLHLRVHGRLLAAIAQDHGHTFRDMLDALGLSPTPIVLQLPETATYDAELAGELIQSYRKYGFGIALQASGTPLALARMAAHQPDVMKVDVRTLGQAAQQVPELLRAAENAAIQLVFTRIDTADAADVLAGLGATYAQGYFFDVPSARLAEAAISA